MNKIILSGNLARNPEFSVLPSGKRRCFFNVAATRRFKNKDGVYEADFISCVAWEHTAEFIQTYFGKGDSIEVEGWLKVDRYEDETGKTQWRTNVIVDYAGFCGKKSDTNSKRNDTQTNTTYEQSFNTFSGVPDFGDDDDVPF